MQMNKKQIQKEDGRYLIYYTFEKNNKNTEDKDKNIVKEGEK